MERPPFDPSLLDRLRALEDELPSDLRDEIMACGEAAVRPLATLFDHNDYAAVFAAEMIGELGPAPVVAELISTLVGTEPDDPLRAPLTTALAKAGPALVEPALRQCAESEWFFEYVGDLALALSRCGVRDERIYALFVSLFDEDDDLAPMYFANYGDVRALPLLLRELDDRLARSGRGLFAYRGVVELVDAIERLGGTITDDHRRGIDRLLEPDRGVRALPAAEALRAPSRPGRNDPCWCGSGKKYKRCHLSVDASTVPPA